MLKWDPLLGVLGILVALFGGCGGAKTLSKHQYVSRLNAMCRDFNQREKRIGEPQTVADLAELGPRILAAFDESIRAKVHGLQAPDEIAGEAERLADLADRQHDTLAALAEAAKRDDLEKVGELSSRNQTLNQEAGSIARELGADACAPSGG